MVGPTVCVIILNLMNEIVTMQQVVYALFYRLYYTIIVQHSCRLSLQLLLTAGRHHYESQPLTDSYIGNPWQHRQGH